MAMTVTRRDTLVGLAASAAALAAGGAAPRPQRPNILWISCEDMSPRLRCYGDPHAITPNLDRLAAAGVRYTHAYTCAGVCAPSRSGIISSMWPTTLGSQHMRCQASLPGFVRGFPAYLREAGYYCTNNSKTDYNFTAPRGTWDESSARAHWRNRQPGQPFFSVFNLTITHEAQTRARGPQYQRLTADLKPEERQDPARLTTLPPYYPDTPEVRRDWANGYELMTVMDHQAGDILAQLRADGLADETIVFFWSDHGTGFPRAKRWVYESGTRAALMVYAPAPLRPVPGLPQGGVDDQLISFLDLAPTVLNLAGVPVPDHFQGRAFLGGGLTPPRGFIYSARDRMDERYDIIRAVRDPRYRYIRNYEPWKPYDQPISYSEQTPTTKELRRLHAAGGLSPEAERFFAGSKPTEELYDVEADPHEVRNLAAEPEHRAALERLRAEHERWQIETRDLGLMPESIIAERERAAGSRYAILHQPDSESYLRRLRQTATLADQGVGATSQLLAGLTDPDDAIRYWAAIGLGRLKQGADALGKALSDASPTVRVAAAWALARQGRDELAVPALTEALKAPNPWVRLRAAQTLDELGPRAAAARGALEALRSDSNEYVKRAVEHALSLAPAAAGAD
jgi:uncharacterized sulfatase